ncbi:MAG: MbtF [Desulfovibrionaceae bacterium]|nr:MbtF [Desulfovibrionaceae bacterium]
MRFCRPQFRTFQSMAVIVAALALQGCGLFSSESESPATQDMEISVKFQDVHRCSRISPEITIVNPPKGTTGYDVRLVETHGLDEVVLGGGSWAEDGSGLIPEGAMTGHYRGPCPPKGESRKYIYVVGAKQGQNPQPLAVRVYALDLD